MGPPVPHQPAAAHPPPLPAADQIALQFANLTANYVSHVRRILRLTRSSPANATQRAFASLTSTDSFANISVMFANNTPFAALLRELNTISVNATHAIHGSVTPATSGNSSTPNAQTNAVQTAPQTAPAPYLQAARTPPSRVNRLPRLHAVASSENAQTPNHPAQLSKQGTARCVRTANRAIGFESHQVVQLKSEEPLRGARYIREGLNEGGFTGPSVVLSSPNPRIHYLIAQPRHLRSAAQSWTRFREVVAREGVPLPTLQFSDPRTPADMIDTPLFFRDMHPHIANERLRLERLRRSWSPKRYFTETLDEIERQLVERLRMSNPNDSIVVEFAKRHSPPDENETNNNSAIPAQRKTLGTERSNDAPEQADEMDTSSTPAAATAATREVRNE